MVKFAALASLVGVGFFFANRAKASEVQSIKPDIIPALDESENLSVLESAAGDLPRYALQGDSMNKPRGIANNNPLNIRENQQSDFDWVGEAVENFDPDFEEFKTMNDGLRAGFVILKTYRNKHGLKTIPAIINRWAPEIENDTDNYINFVAKNSGLSLSKEIQGRDYIKLVNAMAVMENGWDKGGFWFTESELETAAKRAGLL